jgi:hypothetical protein
MSFFKMEERTVKQILSWGWYQWEGVKYKERMKEGEYGGNILYHV